MEKKNNTNDDENILDNGKPRRKKVKEGCC